MPSIQDLGFSQHNRREVIPVNLQDQIVQVGQVFGDNVLDRSVTNDNKAFYQASTPTSGMIENDIWFDSDDTNHPYQYINGAWTSIRDTGSVSTLSVGWAQSIVYTATDHNTLSWGTGSIITPTTTYTIDAGNTGDISATTYIFLDTAVSATVLQTTTAAASAVGTTRLLVAVCKNVASGKLIEYAAFSGLGLGKLITADQIAANTITTNEIAATTITAGNMNISTLSSIVADLGTITSGSITVVNGANTIGFTPAGANAIFSGPTGAPTFYVTPAGALTATSATITGAITTAAGSSIGTGYLSGTIGLANLNVANRGWVQTCAFTITDADTVAWGIGTLTAADGTAYSIDAGNTGNMTLKTYIYLDTAVSSTVYQTTTTATTAVGAGKVLVAIAQNNTTEATFQVMGGQGAQNIDASSIVAGSITGNEIAASTISTGKLDFTAVETGNVIASINSSVEGITIDADNISISGSTTFSSGYDPTSKVDELAGTYASAASGARVLVFPDANTGIQVIDDAAADVFKVEVGGANVGDVTIGNYAGGEGIKYDKSTGTTDIQGSLSVGSVNGSPITVMQPRAEGLYNKTVFLGSSDDGITATVSSATITRYILNTLFAVNSGATNYARLSTAQVGGTISGGMLDWDNNLEFNISAQFSKAATQDIFIGLFSKGKFPPGADATDVDMHIGFYIQDATLYASNANKTTQTRTDVSAGITLTDNNFYRFVYTTGSNVKFYINDVLVATHTTYLPATDADYDYKPAFLINMINQDAGTGCKAIILNNYQVIK